MKNNSGRRHRQWPTKGIAITAAITFIATTHASYAQADTPVGSVAEIQDGNLLLAQADNQGP